MLKRNGKQRRGKKQQAQGYFITGLPDGTFKQVQVPKKRMKDVSKYINAHSLLPEVGGPHEVVPMVEEALGVMANSASTHSELLRAIVILGHAPCDEAFKTLAEHSSSGRPYAGVAEIALRECVSISPTPPLAM